MRLLFPFTQISHTALPACILVFGLVTAAFAHVTLRHVALTRCTIILTEPFVPSTPPCFNAPRAYNRISVIFRYCYLRTYTSSLVEIPCSALSRGLSLRTFCASCIRKAVTQVNQFFTGSPSPSRKIKRLSQTSVFFARSSEDSFFESSIIPSSALTSEINSFR